MVIAKFGYSVSWGSKGKRQEDRFKTKKQAIKAGKELKDRRENYGGKVYKNIRIKRLR